MLYDERMAAAMHPPCPGSSEIPALNNPRAVQSRDTTRAYLEELMANRDKEPPSYDELADAMWLLPKPLPMTPAGFDSLPHSSLNAEDEHQGLVILTCDFPAQALGESVGVSLRRSGNTIDHGGKHAVMIATDWLAIGFMKEVLGFLRIPVTADTAGNIVDRYGETDDTTGDTPGLYQPDATLILQNMLMCKGVVKESSDKLDKALEELGEKMADWSPHYHGTREYIICYAAAGHLLRHYAVKRGGGDIKALSPVFDLRSASDRLKAMHTSISMLTIILQQLKHQFPNDTLPFGVMLKYKHSSIYYSGEHVEKYVDLWYFAYSDKETLLAVYGTLFYMFQSGNTNHPRGLLRPLEAVMKNKRYWKVKLPMGLHEKPGDLDSLREFLRDVLQGLDALHQMGIVHRDVRHPNILKMSDGAYVLMDFEMSARAGKVPAYEREREIHYIVPANKAD